MKKFLYVVIIAVFAGIGIFLGSLHKQAIIPNGISHKPIPNQVLGVSQAPTPAAPVHISIPAISVDANVESVGMDSQGRMGVPTNVFDTAWYNLGFKPGEKGSAVIDGHLDQVTGAPAVFWNLKELQDGDKITITDANKHTYTFVVTDTASYPYNNFPLQQVFDTTDKPRLNLITCAGTWDLSNHIYTNREVVYSVLEQ